ncbi:PREDICTED: transcription factor bHLH117 [Tarenaya hassleriana]|uniref:transcription factor bHLH117 n=1 Tax=Tarenaya hassleriana TaxID=28532 RepID=UPI00053C3509|nr:PREDICTED: transcription factor bHLH117 [Tarenaya hassleriana]
MKIEAGYELDSVSGFPPIPSEFDAVEDPGNYPFTSAINPLEALVPFPHSDFSPSAFAFSDLDILRLQPCLRDSILLDSPLSLINRHLAESIQLDQLFHGAGLPDPATSPFLHMPNLHAVDQTTLFSCFPPALPGVHDEKRRRFTVDVPPPPPPPPVGFTISPSSASGTPASTTQNNTARDRRRKIAEKTRSLEKLMPWEKKMDRATLLEEAHKYIKFLQAQIAVLRWMPLEAVFSGAGGLNRQQVLQVMASSSRVQTTLYTRGCCVFSREQLLSLNMTSPSTRNL